MAGYDFDVKVRTATEDALLRRLLHGMQLGCRQRGVTLRYRRVEGGYCVTVDGPLTNIQASRTPLTIALGAMAEVVDVPLPRARRLQIGRRILRGYVRGAWDITTSVLDTARMLDGTPGSYVFDAVEDQVIQYRLDGLTSILEAWQNDHAPSEQALEELHAVAELTMGFLLGEHWDDRSFSEQAAEMVTQGLMTADHRDVLIELKNRRRAVRHHLATMSRDELAARLPRVLAAIHAIVARLPA